MSPRPAARRRPRARRASAASSIVAPSSASELTPPFRRLRGYAFDPSLSIQSATALINEITFKVPWEPPPPAAGRPRDPRVAYLEPGPVGEYDELLARTVLYKVSHHGSHNGTPKDRGLLRMTSPELAAMIPVDTAKARRLGFTMPLPTLLRGLKQRTRHRVLRADRRPEKPAALTASEWKQFTARVAFRPRYVEYRIPME